MSDHQLSFITHGGHRIATLSYPNPEALRLPVVWIHGLTASLRFWECGMYDEIARERSWYSVSLPVHHPSIYDGKFTADSLDEHLLAELVRLSIESVLPEGKFHLVGYSLGGFACLNYAAKYPQRVTSVVSVGGFMTGRARGLEGVLQFFAQGHLLRRALFYSSWWIMQRHVVFLKLATLFYARRWRQLLRYAPLDPTLKAIFPDVQRHSIGGQRALFRYLLDMDLMDEIDDIQTPTLVVAGDRDPIIPYAHQRAYAARLPRGEFLSLPGVGHVSFAEAPVAFREGILSWLARFD
ncbi:alpha/beta fold hydrolase [Neolewinella litorea]|uniref:Alpha/beta hydrolase n=1 Tax=Neolewinella litorea TaxID=2562452 RepID=A0A4S4NKZ3_9BACT|nr:alpha/beta hydrolase [Neolewinella litorea]THH40574.1 alpha/beta hydrolase [Neolewinella litorea]